MHLVQSIIIFLNNKNFFSVIKQAKKQKYQNKSITFSKKKSYHTAKWLSIKENKNKRLFPNNSNDQ